MSRCAWRRLSLIAVVGLTAGLFTLAADSPEEPTPLKDFKDAKPYKVVRVIDGDTVIIDLDGKQTRVRLIGVDTPETVHPRKAVEFYGKEASRFTSNLLKGESVFLEYDQQKQDGYGRTLAYLYRAPDGLFVNLEIVRQGYGHAYTKYPFKYMELFRRHERAAREAGRGLWGESAPPAREAAPPKKVPAAQGKKGKPDDVQTTTVYVTRTGKKYHLESCGVFPGNPNPDNLFQAKSKIAISLKDAKARGYKPCDSCRPPE